MILNKQLLDQFKNSVTHLSDLLNAKDKMLNDMKKNLTEDELKEFNAIQKQLKKKLNNNDFSGAIRTIEKYKASKDAKENKE